MQLIENIKTFPVQILHHIREKKKKESRCVPGATEDAGFTHTLMQSWLTLQHYTSSLNGFTFVSPPRPQINTEQGEHRPTGRTRLPPVITRRSVTRGQDPGAPCGFGERRGQLCYAAHD